MRWLRLQLPVLYLASILIAGAFPCASHAAVAHEASAAPAAGDHRHHGHHATNEIPERPCHSGEAVCGCEALAGAAQIAVAKPRDDMAPPALAADATGMRPGPDLSQDARRSDPPERRPLVSFFDGIHGRGARLLI